MSPIIGAFCIMSIHGLSEEVSNKIWASLKSEERHIVALIPTGSHLYGTNVEGSDRDFIAVFIPPSIEVALGKKVSIPKIRFNLEGDRDWGLPESRSNKNLIEVSSVSIQTLVGDFLESTPQALECVFCLGSIYDYNYVIESHTENFIAGLIKSHKTPDIYKVLAFTRKSIAQFTNHGPRSKEPTEIGWGLKALSHALRLVIQAEELVKYGEIRFPLEGALYLRQIREGLIPIEAVQQGIKVRLGLLESLIESGEYGDFSYAGVNKSRATASDFVSKNMLNYLRDYF
jgi:hypothetical protein